MDRRSETKVIPMLAALVVVGAGIKFAAPLLVPLLLATFLTIVTAPLVLGLEKRGVPASIAVVLALLIDAAGLMVIGLAVSESLAGFSLRLADYEALFAVWLASTTEWLEAYSIGSDQVREVFSPSTVMDTVASLLKNIAGVLSNLMLVLVIVVFMLFETLGLRDKLLRVIADPARLDRLARGARRVNKYLAVKTATSSATGLLCGSLCVVIGIDFPMLWGLLAFLLNFIPTIGSIIAAVPPVLLALVLLGPGEALGTALGYLAVNFIIGNLLEPRILGRALGLSPLVVFLSMVLWGWLLGPVGALLAVPLTMGVRIALNDSQDFRWVAVLLGPAGEARADTEQESRESQESQAPPPIDAPES